MASTRAGASRTRSATRAAVAKIARLLDEAEDDVLAFHAFPAEHWPKLRSTNPLEHLNREIARRTDVVGIFPDDASLIRLVSMLAIEANDEWLVGRSTSAKARWRLSTTSSPSAGLPGGGPTGAPRPFSRP